MLLSVHEDANDQRVTQADDGEGHQESNRHLQPLDLEDVGEAEVHLAGVLRLYDGERKESRQDGRHPDEAAAELGVLHGSQRTGAHGTGEGHIAVETHPRQEEDAAIHVHLEEKRHEGAQHGVVVVLLVEVEDLDERVHHQNEVRQRQVHKVQIRDGHLLTVVEVDHQNEDVTDEADGEEKNGVKAGKKQSDDVELVGAFFDIGDVEVIRSIQTLSAIHVNLNHSGSLLFHTDRVWVSNRATYFICTKFTLRIGTVI